MALWLIALTLLSGPIDQPHHHGYSGEQSYQERLAPLHVVIVSFWSWTGHYIIEISTAVSALAAGVIAWFTRTLYVATDQQAGLTRQSIALARDEFLATHRPLLRVRYFKRTDADTEKEIDVRFTIVNVGDEDGTMLSCNAGIDFFQEGGLPTPVLFTLKEALAPRPFRRGATDEAIVRLTKNRRFLTDCLAAQKRLHVYGFIVYANKIGDTRTTAFCRRWDEGRDRFSPVGDPDYEYED